MIQDLIPWVCSCNGGDCYHSALSFILAAVGGFEKLLPFSLLNKHHLHYVLQSFIVWSQRIMNVQQHPCYCRWYGGRLNQVGRGDLNLIAWSFLTTWFCPLISSTLSYSFPWPLIQQSKIAWEKYELSLINISLQSNCWVFSCWRGNFVFKTAFLFKFHQSTLSGRVILP